MQKAEAAYSLLTLLSVVDGVAHDNERLVIRLYTKNNYPNEVVDFVAVEKTLANLNAEGILKRFEEASKHFYNQSSDAERIGLMLTAMEVVLADGVETPTEKAIFRGLAEAWQLNYEILVEHYHSEHQKLLV